MVAIAAIFFLLFFLFLSQNLTRERDKRERKIEKKAKPPPRVL
jgi:hypothetical protein